MQERQFPPSGPTRLVTTESRARRLWRAHRIKGAAGLGAIALSLFALGCPQGADLDNPNFYCQPGGSIVDPNTKLVTGCMPVAAGTAGSTGTAGTGGMAAASCESDCMKGIINNGTMACKTCHGIAVKLDMSSLDMETPGYGARLKDHPSEHKGNPAGTVCPSGDKLIDSAAPANSWLLKKVTGMQGSCGVNMPLGGMLSPADQTCVTTFVNCVAGGTPAGGGGMPSGGASTGGGGSGGAATGGGGSGGAAAGSGGSGGAKGGSGGTGGV